MASRNADRKFVHLEHLLLRGAIFLIFLIELIRFVVYEVRHMLAE